MALEDRFSPQSAQSPPHRMPHSPNQHNHTSSNNSSSASPSPSAITQIQNGTSSDTEMAHAVLHSPITIKTEQEDSCDEQCISTPQSPSSTEGMRFSISNILSDGFGKANPAAMTQLRKNHERNLFRPYDIKEHVLNNSKSHQVSPSYPLNLHHPALEHPAFTSLQNLRLAEIYNDYSRKLALEAQSQNLFHSFSSYPRIHEEILNQHRKNNSPIISSHISTTKPPQVTPPLGNLCKTVSQIGRPTITTTPTASISPKSDRSSLISPPISSSKHDSSMIDSSDDTKSETSSTTKGDDNGNGVWPAWVSTIFLMFV